MTFNNLMEHVLEQMDKKGMEKPIFMLDEEEEED
jgi:hypothetical protein